MRTKVLDERDPSVLRDIVWFLTEPAAGGRFNFVTNEGVAMQFPCCLEFVMKKGFRFV